MASRRRVEAGRAFVVIEALDKTGKVLNGISRRLDRFSQTAMNLGRQLGMVAAALTIPFASAISEARNFSDAMLALQAKLRASNDRISQTKDLILNLAETTTFTGTEIVRAANEFSKADFDIDQIEAALGGLLDFAKAGELDDLPAAAISMADAIKAFGLNASDAAEVGDMFFVAATKGTTSVKQLTQALSFSSGTAKQLGFSLAKTLGILSQTSKAMLKSTKGGTSLNQFLLQLAANAQKIEDQLGVTVTDDVGNFRDRFEILSDIVDAVNSMPDAPKFQVLKELFNVRGTRQAVAISQMFDDIENVTEEIEESGGRAQEARELMESGLGGAIDKLRSKISTLKTKVGDALTDSIIAFDETITPVLRGLSNWVENNQEVIVSVAKFIGKMFAAAASLILLSVALKLGAISILILTGAIKTLLLPFRLLWVTYGLLRTVVLGLLVPIKMLGMGLFFVAKTAFVATVALLKLALTGVVALVKLAFTLGVIITKAAFVATIALLKLILVISAGLTKVVLMAILGLGKLIFLMGVAFVKGILAATLALGVFIIKALAIAAPILLLVAAIGLIIKLFSEKFPHVFANLLRVITKPINAFMDLLKALGKGAIDIGKNLISTISRTVQLVSSGIINHVKAIPGAFFSLFKGVPGFFSEIFGGIFTFAKDTFDGIKDRIMAGDIEGALNVAGAGLKLTFQKVVNSLKQMWLRFTNSLKQIFIGATVLITEKWRNAQADISSGILDLAANNTFFNKALEAISGVNLQEELKRGEKLGRGSQSELLEAAKTDASEEFKAAAEQARKQGQEDMAKLNSTFKEEMKKLREEEKKLREDLDEVLDTEINELGAPEIPDFGDDDIADALEDALSNVSSMGSAVDKLPSVLEQGTLAAAKREFANRTQNEQLQALNNIAGSAEEIAANAAAIAENTEALEADSDFIEGLDSFTL